MHGRKGPKVPGSSHVAVSLGFDLWRPLALGLGVGAWAPPGTHVRSGGAASLCDHMRRDSIQIGLLTESLEARCWRAASKELWGSAVSGRSRLLSQGERFPALGLGRVACVRRG